MTSAADGDTTASQGALSLDTPVADSGPGRAPPVARDDATYDDADHRASAASATEPARPALPPPPARRRLFDYAVTTNMFIHPLYAPDNVLR